RVASAAFSLPFSALSICFSTIPSSLLIDRFRAPSRRTTGAASAPWMMVLRFRLFCGRPRGFPDLPGLKREARGARAQPTGPPAEAPPAPAEAARSVSPCPPSSPDLLLLLAPLG